MDTKTDNPETEQAKLDSAIGDALIPKSNPTFMDSRGVEYEIDRKTKAHRRLTPKKLSKKERRRINRIARNMEATA